MNADAAGSTLSALAAAAGIIEHWTDARGRPQRVSEQTLRTLLAALELPAESPAQINDSLARLRHRPAQALPPLQVIEAGAPVDLTWTGGASYRLVYEDGQTQTGIAQQQGESRIRLPAIMKPGYHCLELGEAAMTLAVAPARAPAVADLIGAANPRPWGLSAQVYSLRRPGTMGFGDFAALESLARAAGAQGAAALAISPVHAMFSADPQRYSPYGPSSRLFLNAMYAAPEHTFAPAAVAAALQAGGLCEEAQRLESLPVIEWPAAARLKLALLRQLHITFHAASEPPLIEDFQHFCHAGGATLQSHAVFEALHARYRTPAGAAAHWRDWPAALRDPLGPGVQAYARQHAAEVEFHAFLQWLAARSLGQAHHAARAAGMPIGLIADLAVGTDPAGSHAWSRQADILAGLSVGAPPDVYIAAGQCWNLTAFSPQALRAHGYTAFIEMLRAALAQAGGVRIDHILGLARMWLVPESATPAEGAYLRYPLDDLLRLIALEAWRHRALVIGENLGTVPDGFNERIERAGVLGMSVLWFERDAPEQPDSPARFRSPRVWSAHTVAMSTTHDLPTMQGWWRGRDLDWRAQLQLFAPGESEPALRQQRSADRKALWQAMQAAQCAPAGAAPAPETPPDIAMASFVASAQSPLMLLPLEDMLGMVEQPNLPGTVQSHPNWRQRLPLSADALFADEAVQARLAAVQRHRSEQ